MKRADLIADMKGFVDGRGFITRQQLALYLGASDPHTVDQYLHALYRVGKKYYFIPDVAGALLEGGEFNV